MDVLEACLRKICRDSLMASEDNMNISSKLPKHNKEFNAFTLIELLVVLVIIAIILTVAVMAFGDFGKSRKQHLSILQLEQTVKAAQTQAILQPAVLGLTFTPGGYQYYRFWYDPKTHKYSWINLQDDVLSQPNAFTPGTVITVNHIKTKKHKHHLRVKGIHPLIYFLPNGTITPFKATISFTNGQRFIIDSDGAGGTHVN